MGAGMRVELQAEVDGRRETVYPLVATAAGLRRWLDAADLEPRPGGQVRLTLRDSVASGHVLAIDAPQHISFSWDWEGSSSGDATVVAFDLIDHGARTHLTMRHVGFRSPAALTLHEALWRHWFARLVGVARDTAREAAAPAQR